MIRDRGAVLMFLLVCLYFVAAGWMGGWLHAHQTVATECEKLGRFYVGDQVFDCHELKESSHVN